MTMPSSSSSSIIFKVERNKPEMIPPAKPTPYEFKLLSDIDDQKGFRKQNPAIQLYRNDLAMQGKDPVEIIREATAKALVYYYPFAGRLKEGPNEKLMVECTGEGVLFIEANADVRLDQFGDPPFPCVEELLYDVPGSSGILHCPLLLIQVTRLLCGGFIFAIRLNHSMSDATGLVQFITAVGEIARGAVAPSVQPVWKRELLNARHPPRISCVHRAYDEIENKVTPFCQHQMARRCFFFGEQEIASLRAHMPSYLQTCTSFDLLTACIWRCRTLALNSMSQEEIRVVFPVNARAKFNNPPLPAGFYGNGFGLSAAVSTAHKLCKNPLGYAVELVKIARAEVTEEYMRSLADLLVTKGRMRFNTVGTFVVSDLRRIGFTDVDFGWGKPVYGGPTWGGAPASFFISSKNHGNEYGILVTMDLPEPTMKRFAAEVNKVIKMPPKSRSPFILSYL